MKNRLIYRLSIMSFILLSLLSCKVPENITKSQKNNLPNSYKRSTDSLNIAEINWKEYFSDPYLIALIDTALRNNQELNIIIQEIEISKNEVRARKGEYLPFIGLIGGAGLEKEGKYTRHGAVDENLDIKPGTPFPDPLTDYMLGASASWELDVWKKLRNAKASALNKYLSSIEGRNFIVTNLIAEIASSYYELMALDNLLDIIQQNIKIQSNALKVVAQQKEAAKVTQLAVNRFEAQLLNTQNLQFEIKQKIIETENRINFLTGRFPKKVERNSTAFNELSIDSIQAGIPSQLLVNRPDIRQSELELAAAKLDVKVARANFYPSFKITAGIGFQAFNPTFLVNPESIFYNFVGDMISPLINRNAIKAAYYNANAQQVQAIYKYEQAILNAYIDVANQLSKIENYSKSYETKFKEVELLMQSVTIANNLFYSARADYAEVLFTQREALDSKIELVEIKMKQLNAKISIYRALGGGWR